MNALWLSLLLLSGDPSAAAGAVPAPGPKPIAAARGPASVAAGAQAAPDVAVVCPAEFREALRPWVEFRQSQGHVLAFVSNLDTEEAIRDQIRTLARGGKLKWVVLVGDANPAMDRQAAVRRRCVPAHHQAACVDVEWNSESILATDNFYADLNGNGVPGLAIGRLAVASAEQLTTVVRKILAYEQSTDFGPWRAQVNFVAGVGNFGALTDAVLETGTKKFISSGIPAAYRTTLTNASWRSPFCPPPADFHETILNRLGEGCMFWCYIGHGAPTSVDYLHSPIGNFPILTCRDCAKLKCAHSPPVAIFFACYAGAYDFPDPCLAEELLHAEQGPVAIMAGSRVTMPYAMAVLGSGLMDETFRQQRDTLGEVFLRAKQDSVSFTKQFTPQRLMTDAVAAALTTSAIARFSRHGVSGWFSSPNVGLEDERMEHLQLFNLFGDPLLRIRYPRPAAVQAARRAKAGATIVIQGRSPIQGEARLALVAHRESLRFQPLTAASQPAVFAQTYASANDPVWIEKKVAVTRGDWQTELTIPTAAAGPCHLRFFVNDEQDFALGSCDVQVEPQ
jgi:hypothetical protein